MATAEVSNSNDLGVKNLDDVAIVSSLKDMGWKAAKATNGSGFIATEIKGGGIVGPAKSLKALKTQIDLKSGPVVAKPNGKSNGNGKAAVIEHDFASPEPRLPTMEEPEIDELNFQADKVLDALAKRKSATDEYKDQDEVMRELLRTHGRKRYHRKGKVFSIHDAEKLVIKDDTQNPPKQTKKSVTVIKGKGSDIDQ